jgi:hypothetical protein
VSATLDQGIARIVDQMIALAGGGSFPAVEQIDFVGEDDCTLVYVYFEDDEVNGGLPITSSFDAGTVLREEIETSILAAGLLNQGLESDRGPKSLSRWEPGASIAASVERPIARC